MKKETPNPTVLKRATCKTLSGKSNLTYAVCRDDDGDLALRVLGNDGGGFHSTEPVKVPKIQEALADVDENETFSSMAIGHLFRGQSANNRSFLMAVLREEKIIEPVDDRQRKFRVGDVDGFVSRCSKLKTARKKAPAKAKTPAKKKAPVKAKARAKKKPA